MNKEYSVLLLPGWQNSDADHWQSRWEQAHGYQRVQQHNWQQPLRGDWTVQLNEAVLAAPTAVVLVAPGDVEQADLRQHLPGWVPIARQRLPFAAVVVGSQNDPYCRLARAQQLAADWGAQWVDAGAAGHINSASQLGDWPQGHALLQDLVKDSVHGKR